MLGSAEGSLDGDGGGAEPPGEVGHTSPVPHTSVPLQSVLVVAQQLRHLFAPLCGLQGVPGASAPGGWPGVGLGFGHW